MKWIEQVPPKIEEGTPVAIDIEMFGQELHRLHRPHGTFASMAIATPDAVYQVYTVEDAEKALEAVKDGLWVLQNATYDLTQLRGLGIEIEERPIWDTMLVERVLWNGHYTYFSLQAMARRYLNVRIDKEIRGEYQEATELTEDMKRYGAEDAKYTLEIYNHQTKYMTEQFNKVYWNIDAPQIWAVIDMKPIKVLVDEWEKLVEGFASEAERIQDEIELNVLAYKSVALEIEARTGVYLGKGKSPVTGKKGTGDGTGGDMLEIMKNSYPEHEEFFQNIIDARAYRHAVSHYGVNWILDHVEEGNLVKGNLKITGAKTGRMAADNPNLQNIPIRNEKLGMSKYRDLFVSKHEGGKILVSDVSQQESRILAYITQDESLLEAFDKKEDIHLFVARMIFEDPTLTKKDNSEERRIGKAINLGLSYGLTAYGLSKNANIPIEQAEDYLGRYFYRFTGVQNWIFQQRNKAGSDGYVETPYGRRFWTNPWNPRTPNNAINSPVQGGAANHTKLAVRLFREKCKEHGLDFNLVLVVHDELVLDCKPGTEETYKKLITEAWIESADTLFPGVPFEADTNIGESWAAKA